MMQGEPAWISGVVEVFQDGVVSQYEYLCIVGLASIIPIGGLFLANTVQSGGPTRWVPTSYKWEL